MNGLILIAAALAAPAQDADFRGAPVVKLAVDAEVSVAVNQARPKAREIIEVVEVPDRPPLVAERQPDGTIVLRHRRLNTPSETREEEDSK